MWPSASFAARVCAGVALAMSLTLGAGRRDYKDPDRQNSDISLWIDERQVRMFSGTYVVIHYVLLVKMNFEIRRLVGKLKSS